MSIFCKQARSNLEISRSYQEPGIEEANDDRREKAGDISPEILQGRVVKLHSGCETEQLELEA
jgi:hypothetical protein